MLELAFPSAPGSRLACRPSENIECGPPKTTWRYLIFAKSKPKSECECLSERREGVGGKPDVAKQKVWGCSLEYVFNLSVGKYFSK